MEPKLESLFDHHRLPRGFRLFPLFFYFPLGLSLATVRFFIGIHAFLANIVFSRIPALQCVAMRVMCAVLGFIVIQQDKKNFREDAKVLVVNHVTNFDHLAIKLVRQCIVPSVWDLPAFLTWVLGYVNFGVTEGRQILIDNVNNFIKETGTRILVFPEGATTNGNVGMLKFGLWSFALNQSVQPVLISIRHPPLIRIAPSVLGSRWWSDMFWFLFVPYTVYILKYLSPMEKKPGESIEEFCLRVQNRMCQELSVSFTKYTSFDKVEYAKRLLSSQ